MKHNEARQQIEQMVNRINCKENTHYEATYHEKRGWELLLYKYEKDGNYIEHTFGDYGTTDFLTTSEMLWYLRGINKNI